MENRVQQGKFKVLLRRFLASKNKDPKDLKACVPWGSSVSIMDKLCKYSRKNFKMSRYINDILFK